MDLSSEKELVNTRVKLARLEARYAALRGDTNGNQRVRELSMHSLKRLINQFKEEIARYECRRAGPQQTAKHEHAPRGIQCDVELDNTRRKLRELEAFLAANRNDSDRDEPLRRVERSSLTRLINQLKEEIA